MPGFPSAARVYRVREASFFRNPQKVFGLMTRSEAQPKIPPPKTVWDLAERFNRKA